MGGLLPAFWGWASPLGPPHLTASFSEALGPETWPAPLGPPMSLLRRVSRERGLRPGGAPRCPRACLSGAVSYAACKRGLAGRGPGQRGGRLGPWLPELQRPRGLLLPGVQGRHVARPPLIDCESDLEPCLLAAWGPLGVGVAPVPLLVPGNKVLLDPTSALSCPLLDRKGGTLTWVGTSHFHLGLPRAPDPSLFSSLWPLSHQIGLSTPTFSLSILPPSLSPSCASSGTSCRSLLGSPCEGQCGVPSSL